MDPAAPDVPDVTHYRLPGILAARVVGAALVALAALVLVVTLLVATLGATPDLLVLVAGLGVLGLAVLGWWLRARAYLVRLDAEGYRVGLAFGVGVRSAAWREVADVGTTTLAGAPVVVLNLEAGGRTTLPVGALGEEREQLVRDLQQRLRHGHGLRPLRESGSDRDGGPAAS
ncbi:hypothetical protein [Nocardioides nanhaiensis]|uniref:hypothetical protein n=1 Tax=Nocardioides nanhaiensis TaxID=1476871 RepID=UPI0031E57FB5